MQGTRSIYLGFTVILTNVMMPGPTVPLARTLGTVLFQAPKVCLSTPSFAEYGFGGQPSLPDMCRHVILRRLPIYKKVGVPTEALAKVGGGGGNRTRVRKCVDISVYMRSLSFLIRHLETR
jgi:hypothetical protein